MQSRGRLSYLTSDRTKPITARRLGDDFDLAAINVTFEQKSRQLEQNGEQSISSRPSILKRLQGAKNAKIDTYHDSISRMVDVTPEKGAGFEHWAKVFNLKQSAKSVAELERYGFRSLEDLQTALAMAKTEENDCREALKAVETELYGKKELQKRVLAYANTKSIREEYRALKSDRAKAKYREKHESEFITMDSAKRYFSERGITKIPNYKSLQTDIEKLTSRQNELYEELHEKRDEAKRLQTITDNIQKTIGQVNKRRNEYEI